MKKPLLYVAIGAFIGLTVGALLGYFGRSIVPIRFEPTVNIAQILNLVVTVFIAVMIQNILAEKKSQDRVEKDLILDHVNDITLAATELRNAMRNADLRTDGLPEDKAQFLRQLSQPYERLEVLEAVLAVCGDDNCKDELASVKTAIKSFREAVSDDGLPHKKLTSVRFRDAENAFLLLKKEITQLVVKINRR